MRRNQSTSRLVTGLLTVLLGLTACTTAAQPVLLAGTNIAVHSVALEDVHFDTFNGPSVPLSTISESMVLQLRDAIPPIESPKYTSVAQADQWLRAGDFVVGYVDGDETFAYPVRILNYHEIVNQTVNGTPILVSFCPLCNGGIVYSRLLDDRVLEFGNTSALYESDMVMYDKQTLSYWFQVSGEAIVGNLTGRRLQALPTIFAAWSDWREAYPESRVLSRDTGFSRPYDQDPFVGLSQYLNRGLFPFPVSDVVTGDRRLPAGEQVIGVVSGGEARAYPTALLTGRVINDVVGGLAVAIAINEAGTSWAFERQVADRVLNLEWDGEALRDGETGSRWMLTGETADGPLEGRALTKLATRFSYWFAFVAAFPEATVYQE